MSTQFLRRASLIVSAGDKGLDLSELHFVFHTIQADVESPSNCSIRVYNLSQATVKQIKGEFDKVTLQAGYGDDFGIIFQGNIKQFRTGKDGTTDTYLDILAADGDMAYNYAVVGQTLSAGWTHGQVIQESTKAMSAYGVDMGYVDEKGLLGGVIPNPRGKVLWGLPRAHLRASCMSTGSTWTINNGKVDVIPLTGYKPGDAVVLTAQTGLVGIPEQTSEGISAKCLLNPRLDVGSLMQIDNTSINALVNQSPNAAPVPFNQWTGIQNLATVAADGLYRIYVVEHQGDTRGGPWYSLLIGLAVNPATNQVAAYG